jgi:hypothetical protein
MGGVLPYGQEEEPRPTRLAAGQGPRGPSIQATTTLTPGESLAAEYVFGLHLWRPVLPKLGALVGLAVRADDLAWIERVFVTGKAPG